MLFTTCCFILFFPNCLFRFWCFLFCLFVLPFDLTTSSSSTSSSPFIVMITKITVKFQIRHRTTHIAHSNRTAKFQRILSTCDVLFFVICWNRVVSSVEWCAVAYNFFLPDITNVHFLRLMKKIGEIASDRTQREAKTKLWDHWQGNKKWIATTPPNLMRNRHSFPFLALSPSLFRCACVQCVLTNVSA